MTDIQATLMRVIYTLGQVDVRGRDNLDKLLGCIQALERAAAKLNAGQDKEVQHG